MKGKVYRRNVNPSIHQAGAAAKDLISSGASKHGVPADKLRRDRRRGRRTRQARRAPSRVQAKIRIAPPPPPARAPLPLRPAVVFPPAWLVATTAAILSATCRQIYLFIGKARRRNITPIVARV